MYSLQPPMHHRFFKEGDLWGEGEPGGEALHTRLWSCDLPECGPYRKETSLSSLSWINLFLHRYSRLQFPMSPVSKSRDLTDAEGSGGPN